MTKRGRKSKAERAAKAQIAAVDTLPERPSPPATLPEYLASRWTEIVAAYPADRWRSTDLTLLEEMIRTEQYAADCVEIIERDGQVFEDRLGNIREHPTVATRDRHLKTILSLQRALRLPPSSRMRAESAGLRNEGKPAKRVPWE